MKKFHLNPLMELMVYDHFIAWRILVQLNTSRIYDIPRRRPHSLTELTPVLISINVHEQNSTALRIPLCSCKRTPTMLKLLTSKLMIVVFSSNQSIRALVLLIEFFFKTWLRAGICGCPQQQSLSFSSNSDTSRSVVDKCGISPPKMFIILSISFSSETFYELGIFNMAFSSTESRRIQFSLWCPRIFLTFHFSSDFSLISVRPIKVF